MFATRGLFWRIFAGGLGLLLLVAAAFTVVGNLLRTSPISRTPERLARYAAEQVSHHADDPGRVDAELKEIASFFHVDIAAYGADGKPIAMAGESPPKPRDTAAVKPLRSGVHYLDKPRPTWVAPIPGLPGATMVVSSHPRSFSLARAGTFLAVALLALALLTIPFAILMTRPLAHLADAARRFGDGDMEARSGLKRRDELGELSRVFDEMADRVAGMVRNQRQLLFDVSHEMRTPLARMRVALDLAAEGDVEKARRYLDEIRTDVEELDRIVGDVLASARLAVSGNGGDIPLRREAIDPADVLAWAAERFRLGHPGRQLDLQVTERLPTVQADPELLRRAIDKLLDNAGKYSDAPTPVTLTASVEDGALVIEVQDQGIGVDPEDLPRLFVPFFRTERSRHRRPDGVGLGLPLARRLVEAHGGKVDFRSQVGQGSTVTVRLPIGA